MAEVTYYFNEHTASFEWATNPSYMVDNILTNYAITSDAGDIEKVITNNCLGTDLGTISKVELRVYAYGDGDDRIDFRPQVGETWFTTTYQTTPAGSPDWGAYVDITGDATAPSPWAWADIVNLNTEVIFTKTAKGNTMYCAKVEIRVTYTLVEVKVTQYLAGLDLPIFPHQMDLVSNKLPCPPPY